MTRYSEADTADLNYRRARAETCPECGSWETPWDGSFRCRCGAEWEPRWTP